MHYNDVGGGGGIYYDIVKHWAVISKLHKFCVFTYYDPDSQTEQFWKKMTTAWLIASLQNL